MTKRRLNLITAAIALVTLTTASLTAHARPIADSTGVQVLQGVNTLNKTLPPAISTLSTQIENQDGPAGSQCGFVSYDAGSPSNIHCKGVPVQPPQCSVPSDPWGIDCSRYGGTLIESCPSGYKYAVLTQRLINSESSGGGDNSNYVAATATCVKQ